MFTKSDLIDALRRRLPAEPGQKPEVAPRDPHQDPGRIKPLHGRRFLTEHEIKEALTKDPKQLTLPKESIISPLAQDWLLLKGIRVVRKS